MGDLVWLSAKNLRLPNQKRKLSARFVGPFRVRDAVGAQAYRLALPNSYRIHDVFHVSLLEPWRGRAGEEPAQPMPLADEDGEWEVEEILDSSIRKGKRFYLVSWKDWPEEYSSWQPEEDCANAQEKIQEYESRSRRKQRVRPKERAENRIRSA